MCVEWTCALGLPSLDVWAQCGVRPTQVVTLTLKQLGRCLTRSGAITPLFVHCEVLKASSNPAVGYV